MYPRTMAVHLNNYRMMRYGMMKPLQLSRCNSLRLLRLTRTDAAKRTLFQAVGQITFAVLCDLTG
jgi:hypothetical protein